MKEIRITLDDNVWKKHNKIKGDKTWKDYLLREDEVTEEELRKQFELKRGSGK